MKYSTILNSSAQWRDVHGTDGEDVWFVSCEVEREGTMRDSLISVRRKVLLSIPTKLALDLLKIQVRPSIFILETMHKI